ncbi:hypothetical protein NA78x_000409 [Anatilimnocola sp. NA78]|uniref:hypothetical protein n=1 Tax=Anatilimnocola sp. NA78 TaxID=3415683 RepID=UPI003CE44E7D
MPTPRATKDEAHAPYLKVVRKMNTFVCEGCYGEELCEHPKLGQEWTPEWYLAMAKLAKEQGWEIVSPPAERTTWFFKEFQLLGPKCAAKRHAA